MKKTTNRLIVVAVIGIMFTMSATLPSPVFSQDNSFPSESAEAFEKYDFNRTEKDSQRDPNLCISCSVLIRYANLSNEYILELNEAMMPGMQVMFFSLVGLWSVIQGYRLLSGTTDPRQLCLEFIFVAIGWMLLFQVGTGFIHDVYRASLSVMAGASSIAFVLAEDVNIKGVTETVGFAEYENLVRLVFTVEHAVYKVFDLASSIIAHNTGWNIPLALVYAFILVLPYFLVTLVFLSQVVISVFRLMMLAAFSPFLMMAYAFGWGRGMAQSAIRTIISSIAIMFAVTASVAMVVYAVTNVGIEKMNTVDFGLSLSNPDLVVLILLGWMSTAFMTEATAIANSITGSALSNTGAGVITGGVTGSAIFALSRSRRGLGGIGRGLGYMSGLSNSEGMTGKGSKLYQKVKDVSKGIDI